jgi:CRP/FNR family transcriptional regulator, cyclic AMP receptor protein
VASDLRQSRAVDADSLKTIPLFAELSDRERSDVARFADEVDVKAGKTLAEEGDFAYEFFVIRQGTANVTKDGRVIATLGPDDFFGEIGLVESERRTATVVSTSPMELIVIFGPNFRRLERELPELATQIRTAIGERLKRG